MAEIVPRQGCYAGVSSAPEAVEHIAYAPGTCAALGNGVTMAFIVGGYRHDFAKTVISFCVQGNVLDQQRRIHHQSEHAQIPLDYLLSLRQQVRTILPAAAARRHNRVGC